MLARPAPGSEPLVAGGGIRLEPVRALPAGLLAERRAELLEDRVGRRHPQRTAGLALLVRVVDVVVGRVVLDRARQRVALASVGRPEPPDVHLPQVELGLAIDDPRRDLAPDPTGAGDAVRREPGGDEEAADLRLAEDELVVRGEALRAVDDAVDARVGHRRDAQDGAFHDRLEALHVGRQELPVEVGRDAVERPRRGIALVAAHAQAADLLAEVDEVVRVAELREARMDALDRLGEEVLVGHRDDRHGHADEAADLGGEHPAGIHDDVGPDLRPLAVVLDGDAGHAAALRPDRDDPGPRPDPDALLASAGGERVGEPGRVEPAVGRQPDGAEDAVGRHQREAVLRLLRRDEVERQTERLGPARLASELLEPLRRRRQPERADLVPRRIRARLGGQPPVQLGAVHHHPGEGHGAPELADQSSRVEGRSGGQLGAVDEDDVGPAALREVVGDARPADPAADDDGPRVFHSRRVAAALSSRRATHDRRGHRGDPGLGRS